MSGIDDIFDQSRIDFKLSQKPNWNGTVYGVCRTMGCVQYGRVGYYEGGLCKKCSVRHKDDLKRYTSDYQVRWIESKKMYVKDLSHNLSGSERREFYMTPEERIQLQDTVDYEPPKDDDEDWYED